MKKKNMLWYGDYRAVCGCCFAQAQRVDVVTGECRADHAERPTNRELLHGRSRDRGIKKKQNIRWFINLSVDKFHFDLAEG
jgi:hypothetical protein